MIIYTIDEIKALRKYLSMSVETFYTFLGLTKQQGYNLEKGKSKPSLVNRIAATAVLNWMYSEEGIDILEVLNHYKEIKDNPFYDKVFKKQP